MFRSRLSRVIRVVALALLVSAAVDLSVPSCCADGQTSQMAGLSCPLFLSNLREPAMAAMTASAVLVQVKTEQTSAWLSIETQSLASPARLQSLPRVPSRPTSHPRKPDVR